MDYYFTYKDKKVVAEIKVRDIKYEGYDTHLMEVSKYKSLMKDKKNSQSDTAYYINFFQMELKLMPIGTLPILSRTMVL